MMRNTTGAAGAEPAAHRAGGLAGVATGITQCRAAAWPDRLHGRRFRLHVRHRETKNSAAGVPVLLGFTFFMGLMLSRLIGMVLGFRMATELIMTAFARHGRLFVSRGQPGHDTGRPGMGQMNGFVGWMVNVFGLLTAGMSPREGSSWYQQGSGDSDLVEWTWTRK